MLTGTIALGTDQQKATIQRLEDLLPMFPNLHIPKVITGVEAFAILRQPEYRHQFFGGEFVKKDGTYRQFNGRQGVKKHLQGGELKYTPSEHGYIIYWDRVRGEYRTLNTNTLTRLRVGKQDYMVVNPPEVEVHQVEGTHGITS